MFEGIASKQRHWHPWQVPHEVVAPPGREIAQVGVDAGGAGLDSPSRTADVNAQKALVWVAALLLATCGLFPIPSPCDYCCLRWASSSLPHCSRAIGSFAHLPSIWIPFALWAAWAALSLAWSLEPERTLKEWRNEVFYAGATLWVCFVAAQARGEARIFLLAARARSGRGVRGQFAPAASEAAGLRGISWDGMAGRVTIPARC